jgi:hypothetical protein
LKHNVSPPLAYVHQCNPPWRGAVQSCLTEVEDVEEDIVREGSDCNAWESIRVYSIQVSDCFSGSPGPETYLGLFA